MEWIEILTGVILVICGWIVGRILSRVEDWIHAMATRDLAQAKAALYDVGLFDEARQVKLPKP